MQNCIATYYLYEIFTKSDLNGLRLHQLLFINENGSLIFQYYVFFPLEWVLYSKLFRFLYFNITAQRRSSVFDMGLCQLLFNSNPRAVLLL